MKGEHNIMTLLCEHSYPQNNYGKGIFISLVTIAHVEDISGQDLYFQDSPIDIGLKLYLDIKKDFMPELNIGGYFERDNRNNVTGWGSAFVVQDFLNKLGFKGKLASGNRIPKDILQSLEGKQFYRLSYVCDLRDGKLKYCDWNIIAAPDETPESLAKRFSKSLLKGYPKNYHGDLIDKLQEKLEPEYDADIQA